MGDKFAEKCNGYEAFDVVSCISERMYKLLCTES